MQTDLECVNFSDHQDMLVEITAIISSVMLFLLIVIACVNYRISKLRQDIHEIKEFPEYKFYQELIEKSRNLDDINMQSSVASKH